MPRIFPFHQLEHHLQHTFPYHFTNYKKLPVNHSPQTKKKNYSQTPISDSHLQCVHFILNIEMICLEMKISPHIKNLYVNYPI